MRQTRNSDPLARLQSIQVPVLLLWGEKDAFIPVSNAQDYLKAIPQAKLVTLPGVGHVLHEEAPQASVQAVREFLAEQIEALSELNAIVRAQPQTYDLSTARPAPAPAPRQPAPAPRFSATPGKVQGPPPVIGGDTETALKDWGFASDEIAALKTAGAV